MPIYEYQCATCGVVSDIKHGFKETPNEPCPKCAGTDLKRLFNAASIVFKGSGFYVNDSRKSSDASKTEAKSDSVKSEVKSDAVKTETKPASGGKSDAAA